jgi:CRP-like cAMP-binding protein
MTLRRRAHEPLADLPLFAGCSAAQVATARRLLTLLSVDAGSVLMREGGFGTEVMIVADGHATVARHTDSGESVLATVGRGDVVGEMSVLDGGRRSATVTAVTPMSVYVASAAEFAGLLEALPVVAERIARTATERRDTNRRSALAA